MRLYRAAPSLSMMALLCLSAHANADTPYLLGDWGGKRSELEDRGVVLNFGYTSEDAHNVKGGTRHTTEHAGQFAMGALLDLDKLWGWNGMQAGVQITHREGDNLSDTANLHELLQSQETYGRGKIWRLSGLWVSKSFADDKVKIKAGRMAIGDDFNTLDCMAMDLTFCGSQVAMFAGDYWMNGPVSEWGLAVNIRPVKDVYVRFGVYQVNPAYTNTNGGGLRFNPSGTTGALTPVELGWDPSLNGLQGHYAIGGWYSSAPRQDVYRDINGDSAAFTGLDLAMRSSAYGGYLSAHQQFTHGNGGDPESGFRAEFDMVQTDHRTGKIDRTMHLIGMYTGPVASRPHDQVGLGIAATHINQRYTDYLQDLASTTPYTAMQSGNEYTAELFYKFKLNHGITLIPVAQYVVRPGASSANSDVMVIGLRTNLAF